MLTISVHGISLHAKVGLYPEEKITGNNFEIDVDVKVDTNKTENFPFIDYSIINEIVHDAFQTSGDLLEEFVKHIHQTIKSKFPEAHIVKVTIRKLEPPMQGDVKYAQVCFEA